MVKLSLTHPNLHAMPSLVAWTMVFQKGFKRKKKGVGRRQKKGHSFHRYQNDVAAMEQDVAHSEETDEAGVPAPVEPDPVNHHNLTLNAVAATPTTITAELTSDAISSSVPNKKRKDDTWADGYRVKRAVASRDTKIRKLQEQNHELQKQTNKAERGRKKAEQEKKAAVNQYHREKKISREMSLEREKDHNNELQILKQTHDDELSSAFALLALATQQQLVSEAARIESEQKLAAEQDKVAAASLSSEQNLASERAKSSKALATARANHKKKIDKDKRGQKAAMAHLEKSWKKKMDDALKELRSSHKEDEMKWTKKLEDKNTEMNDDRVKNQDRYVTNILTLFSINVDYRTHFSSVPNICHSINLMQERLDKKINLVLEEKQKRWRAVAREVEKRKAVELAMDEMEGYVAELQDQITAELKRTKDAQKDTKAAKSAKLKAEVLSSNRLSLLKNIRLQVHELKDQLADESKQRYALERLQTIQLQIKKERPIGRRGGASRWPVHVVLLICELLVNGTPPTVVRKNIQTTSAFFTGKETSEPPPSVNFIRGCRSVLQIINEALSALRLGTAETWHQLFTDGTSRRQIAFQNLVIALMENGKLDPVIVSSCMVVEDETSENQVKSITDMVRYIYYT